MPHRNHLGVTGNQAHDQTSRSLHCTNKLESLLHMVSDSRVNLAAYRGTMNYGHSLVRACIAYQEEHPSPPPLLA